MVSYQDQAKERVRAVLLIGDASSGQEVGTGARDFSEWWHHWGGPDVIFK